MQYIRKFVKNSKGATAIEYGLIAALIAVAAIAAMQGIGSKLNSTFNRAISCGCQISILTNRRACCSTAMLCLNGKHARSIRWSWLAATGTTN